MIGLLYSVNLAFSQFARAVLWKIPNFRSNCLVDWPTLFLALDSELFVVLTSNFGVRPDFLLFFCFFLSFGESFKIRKIVAQFLHDILQKV